MYTFFVASNQGRPSDHGPLLYSSVSHFIHRNTDNLFLANIQGRKIVIQTIVILYIYIPYQKIIYEIKLDAVVCPASSSGGPPRTRHRATSPSSGSHGGCSPQRGQSD